MENILRIWVYITVLKIMKWQLCFFSLKIFSSSSFQAATVEDYTILEEIGHSTFGIVTKARKGNDQVCALKKIKLRNKATSNEEENRVCKRDVKHVNIVKVLRLFQFQEDIIYVAMELCDANLEEYFIKKRPDIKERYDLMLDMAKGMKYLHDKEILHGDIKPQNILMKNNVERYICKISDFQMSGLQGKGKQLLDFYTNSPGYLAPEAEEEMALQRSTDTFTIGLLFFATFKSSILKDDSTKESLIPGELNTKGQIVYLNNKLKEEIPSEQFFLNSYFRTSSSSIGRLLYCMLNQKPSERPDMEMVLIQVIKAQEENKYQIVIDRRDEVIRELKEEESNFRQKLDSYKATLETMQIQIENLQCEAKIKDSRVKCVESQLKTLEADCGNKLEQQRYELRNRNPEKKTAVYSIIALVLSGLVFSLMSVKQMSEINRNMKQEHVKHMEERLEKCEKLFMTSIKQTNQFMKTLNEENVKQMKEMQTKSVHLFTEAVKQENKHLVDLQKKDVNEAVTTINKEMMHTIKLQNQCINDAFKRIGKLVYYQYCIHLI